MTDRKDRMEFIHANSQFHSVLLDPNLCVGCTTCIRYCPTQAIRVRDGKARIFEERCIDCGECIRRCPKGAKKAVSDPLLLMGGYDCRVALPAPSLYGQFGTDFATGEIFEAFYSLGFDEVFDVAWGAVKATEITREILKLPGLRPRISSACPVIVRLIQQRFPSLIPNLMPILPPSEIAAMEVRRRLAGISGKIGVFFISPCTAKVTAVRMPLGFPTSFIDAVLSFQDLFLPLKKTITSNRSKPPARKEHLLQRMEGLEPGLGWARSDGELEALHIDNAVTVDGIGNVIELFEAIENDAIDGIDYIEALACPGGCVGGPMAVENAHVARTTMRIRSQSRGAEKTEAPSPTVPASASSGTGAKTESVPAEESLAMYSWSEPILPKPVQVLDNDMAKALMMAEEIDILLEKLPGIDCGACGAPDCHALAEDIVRGMASFEDCIIAARQKKE